MQDSPLELCQEVSSSLRPFLKYHVAPLSFEANSLILQNLMDGLGGGREGEITSPTTFKPWVTARYGPLNLPQHVHDLPENYLKLLPKYDGEKTHSTKEHIAAFQEFTENLFVEHDNVFMRIFVQTLEGDIIKWFRELPIASIDSYRL
jgi:hypothetical protein